VYKSTFVSRDSIPCQSDEEESNVGLLPPRPDPAKMVGNYGAYDGDSEYENCDYALEKWNGEWWLEIKDKGFWIPKSNFCHNSWGCVFLSLNNLVVCIIGDIEVIVVQD
jgi:hypothetical protein